MTAWGNALPKPWHMLAQPLRLSTEAERLGFTALRVADSRPPRGRVMVATVEISDALSHVVATAWFRQGSFVAGKVGADPGYRTGGRITPRELLEAFLRDLAKASESAS